MPELPFPQEIPNWIEGKETSALSGERLDKFSPADGRLLCRLTASNAQDVEVAIAAARAAAPSWAQTSAVTRGQILHNIVMGLEKEREAVARTVALETGKSISEAQGETGAAIAQGLFMSGEGQRLFGRTIPSGGVNRIQMTVRQPRGVAGLIIAANTPIANVAWKVFPALICGNTAVLKAAEDTPATAWLFAKIAHEAGLPAGVLNVIQGSGPAAGAPLVAHADVDVVSFTGSTAVGRQIARIAGKRLAHVSLELGGKNPLVVCDDADLENAVRWAALSAFSNAGQRCAAGSRLIVFDEVYAAFRDALVTHTQTLRVGSAEGDDLGPVINEGQLGKMLYAIRIAKSEGAKVILGGHRITNDARAAGYYMTPTLVENVKPDGKLSTLEIFGPIAVLYRVANLDEALALANNSPYGLTASIHTKNIDRALRFAQHVEAGVAMVNAGTYGSEPHMPFGGRKQSGNGTREPGTEALDVYSELKNICINFNPEAN